MLFFKNYKRTLAALLLLSFATSQLQALELKSVFLLFAKNSCTSKTVKYLNKKNIFAATSIMLIGVTIASTYLFITKKWPFNLSPEKNNPDNQSTQDKNRGSANNACKKTNINEEIAIDLKINEKPEYIGVYKWCNQRAEELVLEKKLAILAFLGKSETEFNIEEENLKLKHKKASDSDEAKNKKQALPKNIQDIILETLENNLLQKKLGITKIFVENNFVILERKDEEPIKFLNIPGSAFSTYGYNVGISQKKISEKRISKNAVKAFIGHELAHIKFKHNLKRFALVDMFNKEKKENKSINNIENFTKEFNELLSKFNKATEVQADIFCFLKDKTLLKSLVDTFNNMTQDPNTKSSVNHPKCYARSNYLNQIYLHIKDNIAI